MSADQRAVSEDLGQVLKELVTVTRALSERVEVVETTLRGASMSILWSILIDFGEAVI